MSRHFRNHDLERRPDQPFDEMPAMSRRISLPEHGVRVHFWFIVVDRHIADEREHFDLLVNRYMLVLLRGPFEISNDSSGEGTDGGELTATEMFLGCERRKRPHRFVTGLTH